MSKYDKLLKKAENSPNNFSFTEICQLAECFGFEFQRKAGSHVIYEHPNLEINENRLMNFQNFKGKARAVSGQTVVKSNFLFA
ncbi:MAG: type II toxin-antitoxin system HicA family toxin [Pyrinomonadaceae bacterium]